MTTTDPTDWFPVERDQHFAQLSHLNATLAHLDDPHILDLGAGDGRTAVPLARSGVHITAIDNNTNAINALTNSASKESLPITTINADFASTAKQTTWPIPADQTFDAAACLGNTFMLLHDPLHALALLEQLKHHLPDDAPFFIDDILTDTWDDVADAAWAAGIAQPDPTNTDNNAPDETMQLLWSPRDTTIALRAGDRVNPSDTHPTPDDRLLRLYSLGELRLLAHAAGYHEPELLPDAALIRFTPKRP